MSLTALFLKVANLFFILCYVALIIATTQKSLFGEHLFLGFIVVAFLSVQLVGHILGKAWALKNTAAILGGFNIIFIVSLLPFPFESQLQPALFERLLIFFQQTMVAITAFILYGLRRELNK